MFDFSAEPGRTLLREPIKEPIQPLVSVVTPYYNAGKYFEQTFNCLMNQSFPWFEWIIVNDGSTNELDISVLRRFAALDSRISVVNKENGGIASARNLGIEYSKTEIIVPLDADDLISSTYLEVLYWALYYNPGAAWAYTDCVGFGDEQYIWQEDFSALRMRTENVLVCTAAIKKKDLLEVGCYQMLAKHFNEDWYTWLNMLSRGKYPVHLGGTIGFWYRRLNTGVRSIVDTDKEAKKRSKEIISQMASKVKEEVPTVVYPKEAAGNCFVRPKTSQFEYKHPAKHDKMRILMLLPWMEMGGADLFNLNIARLIDRNRFEVSIMTTVNSKNAWKQRFEEYASDVFCLPSFLDMEHYAEFISYYIRSREIDVLFVSNSFFGYTMLPWLRKEFPDLAIIDYIHMEEWYWRSGGYARSSGMLGDILEKTYVCNGKTRNVLIDHFGRKPESVSTMYIGVDHKQFDPAKGETGKAREMLGIAEDRPIILFPCRIHAQKRPFLMLQIALHLKKIMPQIAVAVVGDGEQYEEVKQASQMMGLNNTVYFAGSQKDMLPWYKDASLTLVCSIKEGLSLTAYESMSMATPVITSDVGGQAELVNEDNGAVLPLLQEENIDFDVREYSQKEIDQYVDAIYRLLNDSDRYQRLCKNCRERIIERFSQDLMIKNLEEAFMYFIMDKNVLEKRRSVSNDLKKVSGVIDEMLTLSVEFHLLEKANKILNKTVIDLKRSAYDLNPQQLSELNGMRLYHFFRKYRVFFNETNCGRVLKTALKKAYHSGIGQMMMRVYRRIKK